MDKTYNIKKNNDILYLTFFLDIINKLSNDTSKSDFERLIYCSNRNRKGIAIIDALISLILITIRRSYEFAKDGITFAPYNYTRKIYIIVKTELDDLFIHGALCYIIGELCNQCNLELINFIFHNKRKKLFTFDQIEYRIRYYNIIFQEKYIDISNEIEWWYDNERHKKCLLNAQIENKKYKKINILPENIILLILSYRIIV
jgi:hypothetical protein